MELQDPCPYYSSCSISYNLIAATSYSNIAFGVLLVTASTVNSSKWDISYNTMNTTSTGSSPYAAYSLYFMSTITLNSSKWDISFNNMNAISSGGAYSMYFTSTTVTSSTWLITSNTMVAISNSSKAMAVFFINTIAMLFSRWYLSYNDMVNSIGGQAGSLFLSIPIMSSSSCSISYNLIEASSYSDTASGILFFTSTTVSSSNWSISYNNMKTTSTVSSATSLYIMNSFTVTSSYWSISFNNMVAISNSNAMALYFINTITMMWSSWLMSNNNLTATSTSNAQTFVFSSISVSSSNLSISYNNMVGNSDSGPVYAMFFSNSVTLLNSTWHILYNDMRVNSIGGTASNVYLSVTTMLSSSLLISYNFMKASSDSGAAFGMYFWTDITVSSSNWSITYNTMRTKGVDNSAHSLYFDKPIAVSSSSWSISYNNLNVTGGGGAAYSLYFTDQLSFTLSSWSIAFNKMTSTSNTKAHGLYFIKAVALATTNWNITYNNMTAISSNGACYALLFNVMTVTTSSWITSHNNLKVTSNTNIACALCFSSPVTVSSSNWSMTSNDMNARSGFRSNTFFFGHLLSVSSSNWFIANNNMSATSNTNGACVLCFAYLITIDTSNWSISYNTMKTASNSHAACGLGFISSVNVTSSTWFISYNNMSATSTLSSSTVLWIYGVVSIHNTKWSLCYNIAVASAVVEVTIIHFAREVAVSGGTQLDVVGLGMALSSTNVTVARSFIRFSSGLITSDAGRVAIINCVAFGDVTNASLVYGTLCVGISGTLAMVNNRWYGSLLTAPYNSSVVDAYRNVTRYTISSVWAPCGILPITTSGSIRPDAWSFTASTHVDGTSSLSPLDATSLSASHSASGTAVVECSSMSSVSIVVVNVSAPWALTFPTTFTAPVVDVAGRLLNVTATVAKPIRFRAVTAQVGGYFALSSVSLSDDGSTLRLVLMANRPEDTSRDALGTVTLPVDMFTCSAPNTVLLSFLMLKAPPLIPTVVTESVNVVAQSASVVSSVTSTPTVALTLQRLGVVSSSCMDEIVSLSIMDSPTLLAVGEGPLDLLRGAAFMNPVMIAVVLVAAAVLDKSAPQLGVSIAHGFMLSSFLLGGVFKSAAALMVSVDATWSDVALGVASLLCCAGMVLHMVRRTTYRFEGDLVGNATLLATAPWHRRLSHKSHHWSCQCTPLCRGSRFPWQNALDLAVTAVLSFLQGAFTSSWCMTQGSIAAVISCSYVVYLVVLRPAVTPLDNVELITLNVLVVVVNVLSLIHRVTPSDDIRSLTESLDTCSLLLGCLVAVASCLKLLLRLCMTLRIPLHGTPPKPVVDAHLSKTDTAVGRRFERRAECWCCVAAVDLDPTLDVLLLEVGTSAGIQEDEQCDKRTTKDLKEHTSVDNCVAPTLVDVDFDSTALDLVIEAPTLLAVDSLVVSSTNSDHNLSLFNYLHLAMPGVPPPLNYEDL